MSSPRVATAVFPKGSRARVLQISQDTRMDDVVDALELPTPRAVVVLNGGTARMEPGLEAQVARILQEGLARFVVEEQVTVITGGTDAGIFHLLGEGFGKFGPPAACIGVAVAGLVTWIDDATAREPADDRVPLEPHHSHFVLVEGREWGDETKAMYALVDRMARDCPSMALFAGGGELVAREMQANLAQQRAMILLAGSGRMTDAVLSSARGIQQRMSGSCRLLDMRRSSHMISGNRLRAWHSAWPSGSGSGSNV